MKKITLFILCLFAGTLVFAQEAQLGLKGGLNISTTTNSDGYQRGSRAGLNAGILAHVHLNPDWAIQPEVMFSSQGAKYTTETDGEHSLVMNYINIPVQLQYMFANGFRLQTGPQVGFLASVKDIHNGSETGYITSQDFKNVDFSWSVGLGYEAASGLGIDGRYNFGLNNINNARSAIVHNSVFQIGLFYMLKNNSSRRY
ncbi:MAG: porin family protein [Flavisolibacter sp.]